MSSRPVDMMAPSDVVGSMNGPSVMLAVKACWSEERGSDGKEDGCAKAPGLGSAEDAGRVQCIKAGACDGSKARDGRRAWLVGSGHRRRGERTTGKAHPRPRQAHAVGRLA